MARKEEPLPINEQIVGIVDTELQFLQQQYNQAGVRRLVGIVDVRSRRPGSRSR